MASESNPVIRKQVHQYFVLEALKLLSTLEQELLDLQESFSLQKVNNLMRTAHTLKGAAASIGLETIRVIAKSLEDIFRSLCHADQTINSTVETLLFEGLECLRLALNAECIGKPINDREILERTATTVAQIQEQMGNTFNPETALPSAAELGYDLTKSMFETGVSNQLDKIAAALDQGDPTEIARVLRTQARVFLGLAEAEGLPGFGAIAQAALDALDSQPEQVVTIAQVALEDFRAGQAEILAGDRTVGGSPSEMLQRLAGASFYSLEQGSNEADLVVEPGQLLNLDPERPQIPPFSSSPEQPIQIADSPALSLDQASSKLEPKILIVDDSLTVRQTLVLIFEESGYNVVQAEDGCEAIGQLQQHNDIQLIICDIEMPRMDGLEFLSFRQHDPSLAKIPVIVLTSIDENTHRSLALQLGATTYVTKDFYLKKRCWQPREFY